MGQSLDFLNFADIPPLARRSYALELRHMLMWGLFANLIDGSFSSIVVAKTFHASPLLVSVVWATPMLAHVLSLVWGVLVRGRPKVRTFSLLAFGAIAAAASISLTPSEWQPWGGWIFAAQIAVSRIFLSGLVTVRTSLWNVNYPVTHRARIAGRIQKLNALLMLLMLLTASRLFDAHPDFYRIVYPLAAVFGVVSLIPFRQLRVRGERRALREWRESTPNTAGRGLIASLRSGLGEAVSILRVNRPFARYCKAMYFLGSSNFMVDPVLTLVLTKQLQLGYFESSLLMDQLPSLVALLTMGFWANQFDRSGVPRFRVVNSLVWLSAVVFVTLGVFTLAVWPSATALTIALLVAGRIMNGAGRGGGAIAWNLGHLHFAGKHDAELYMGIHVTLTGLRGMVMTFVGIWAYETLGWWSMLIAVAMGLTAYILFRRLAADESANGRAGADAPGVVAEPLVPVGVAD